MSKLDPAVEKALNETGLPWAIENHSTKRQVRVGGRLAGVLPYGTRGVDMPTTRRNLVSQIKRTADIVRSGRKGDTHGVHVHSVRKSPHVRPK